LYNTGFVRYRVNRRRCAPLSPYWEEQKTFAIALRPGSWILASCLLFHQNLPLFLEKVPFEVYEEILEYLRWSDRADFWAFFHQCWNLLPLSYHLKLKYPNLYLQHFEKPSIIPEPHDLQYTLVLTKQSALFNAWKEMNRVSIEHDIPFRCVTQWATHQSGKLFDTLGLKLEVPNLNESELKGSDVLSSVPSATKSAVTRKRAVRGKKSSEMSS
jgi:hypothetical protein